MRQNIQRTEQRQGNIDELEDATTRLGANAAQFKRGTNRVYKKLWWKNVRLMGWIIFGVVIAIIIIALGLRNHICGVSCHD